MVSSTDFAAPAQAADSASATLQRTSASESQLVRALFTVTVPELGLQSQWKTPYCLPTVEHI